MKNLIQPEELFKKYMEDFPSLGIYCYESYHPLSKPQSDLEWRSRNFRFFQELGESRGFECRYSGHGIEYHVDLCWLQGYPSGEAREKIENWGKREHFMELALEHEVKWKASEVYLAFSKLVDVKAYLKVYMCLPRRSLLPYLPEALARVVSTSPMKQANEAYLLVIFSDEKKDKALRVEGFKIDYQGNLTLLGSQMFSGAP